MATHQIMAALFLVLALARVGLSTGQVLKSSVTCLDCDKNYDFSGIKIALKCKHEKKLRVAYAEKDGSFKASLPTTTSVSCMASILGSPEQLYTKTKNMVTDVVKVRDSSYTTASPLSFYKSCPMSHDNGKCGAPNSGIYSSKTIDLPLPREWGLAPSSYYVPIVPIIGIP